MEKHVARKSLAHVGSSQRRTPLAPSQMLPEDDKKPTLVNTGMAVLPDVLARLDEIVRAKGVKSRNKLIGGFLKFAVDLFPHMELLGDRIKAVQEAEGVSQAEAIALVLRRGLEVWEREKKGKR